MIGNSSLVIKIENKFKTIHTVGKSMDYGKLDETDMLDLST